MNSCIIALTGCVVWVAASAAPISAQKDVRVAETAAARAQSLVAGYFTADDGKGILNTDCLGAERDSLRVAGAELWRVELCTDHAHPYLVGITPRRAIPLAGFPTPDLYSISRMLGPIRHGLQARVRLLEILADPSGGQHVVQAMSSAPNLTVDSGFVRLWRAQLPTSWPRDTVVDLPGGTHAIVQSVLSRDERDFGSRWTAIVYRFVLAPDGAVSSWARSSTKPFQMPKQMGELLP